MEHVSFVLKIDPQHFDEYKKRHERVDPELEEQFAAIGIRRYHIFFHDDGTLFAYMEVDDFDRAMEHLDHHPANAKWQVFMSDLLKKWDNGSIAKKIPEVYRFIGE